MPTPFPSQAAAEPKQTLVCLVDDEKAVRDLAEEVLTLHGYRVRAYGSAESFLADFDEAATSCVITDLRMPKIDGIELQRRLNERGSIVSLIILSGLADVRSAVRLMQGGALTLLEKPYSPAELTAAVDRAVSLTQSRRAEQAAVQSARLQYKQLTSDELEVMNRMISGLPNKAIAMQLRLSMRTVDRRRRIVLDKMAVSSIAELATMVARITADGVSPSRGRSVQSDNGA